ncbi:guanine nucleotide-releasing factor 2 isoform X2 [Lucilia sericata]|uniref:guanine nucleotide-releasing factor 2 isoform X2 n=1 Tax=Lucilia sericata TaxID=13632 RepID=UPI0018A8498B|nr:guanine nucleotide-releasing factor 2 isoform X2 [Lucilia sericata]
MMQKDIVISTPSTPNSTLSSQTNLYGSPNTPSPATPTQQTSTPLGSGGTSTGTSSSNQSVTGSSGHKNSLKGTKLARRARSFKDDLFEKINLMRTPTNTLGRSHSPQSPRHKKEPPTAEEVDKSAQSLAFHVKDISNALKHFRDVVHKKKLEVLPGNGTVILEYTAGMISVIQAHMLNENNAVLVSATQQVYRCLGKLIKFSDEVMLSEESEECSSLNDDNVREIVDPLEEAVRNLATLAHQKLKEREGLAFQYDTTSTDSQISTSSGGSNNPHNLLMRPSVEVAGQRTSLPDITLTPKERDTLEKTTSNPLRSHSTESILRDTSPPPKPPLPNRSHNPPPLPPKRVSHTNQHAIYDTSINTDLDHSTDVIGVDHLSVRSRSPDENSSQCSFDHSREEDICQRFNMAYDKNNTEGVIGGGLNKLNEPLTESNITKAKSGSTANTNIAAASGDLNEEDMGKTELRKANNHRHSNESGFVSINSFRTSTQSYSKSSTKSSNSSSELAIMTSNNSINDEFFQIHNMTQTTKKTSSVCISSTSSISESSALRIGNDDERRISSPDQFEDERKMLEQLQAMSTTTTSAATSSIASSTTKKLLMQSNSLDITDEGMLNTSDLQPPALPPKISKLGKERQLSPYDLEFENINELPELRVRTYQWQTRHTSLIDSRRLDKPAGSCNAINITSSGQIEEPPPLPMKKKHILAYMEICSASTQQHRHTISDCNLNRNITHSQTMNIATFAKEEFVGGDLNETPPALPPKNHKQILRNSTSPIPPTIITTPPPSPKPKHLPSDHRILMGSGTGNEMMTTLSEEVGDQYDDESGGNILHSHELQNVYDTSMQQKGTNSMSSSPCDKVVGPNGDYTSSEMEEMVNYNNYNRKSPMCTEEINHLPNILEEVDITPYLVFKKDNEDGPEVRGGHIDALIVHASRASQKDKAFSEAFITTFRTFIQPIDLIEKLTHRYTVFFCQSNDQKQKAAKETFSLLVRVVNDLTCTDLTCANLLTLLVEFVYELVCAGQLYLAKLLRKQIEEKVNLYKKSRLPAYPTNTMFSTVTVQPSLLDFKALEIAKQMTLLDAELFQKIEIPEVLIFAKDQCEEKSPNLNKFTEHFNKMSYWARSKILMLQCAKEREKYVEKFIKIMIHLKKIHNYNSYLALLSALDSSPIRRLEWNKSIKENIQNNCNIIDSSSSFRNYRQALADTQPPCIPYIGLVLQDLTFVHVGNPDYLKDGIVNFSKRWQQYNIIVNMKRFKKGSYTYRRNERIIRFFDNFENFLGEEDMWQISKTIKP